MAVDEFDPRACVASALLAHRVELRRYVRLRVAAADVDDILQSAALRAIEKAAWLQDPARVLQWLYRVHGNVAMDVMRKRSSERRLIEAASLEAEPAPIEASPTCGCSVAQARKLSSNYASILNLVDIGGVSLTNAARALNISLNNATGRLHRARTALKKRLLEHCSVHSLRSCLGCQCNVDGCCTG